MAVGGGSAGDDIAGFDIIMVPSLYTSTDLPSEVPKCVRSATSDVEMKLNILFDGVFWYCHDVRLRDILSIKGKLFLPQNVYALQSKYIML